MPVWHRTCMHRWPGSTCRSRTTAEPFGHEHSRADAIDCSLKLFVSRELNPNSGLRAGLIVLHANSRKDVSSTARNQVRKQAQLCRGAALRFNRLRPSTWAGKLKRLKTERENTYIKPNHTSQRLAASTVTPESGVSSRRVLEATHWARHLKIMPASDDSEGSDSTSFIASLQFAPPRESAKPLLANGAASESWSQLEATTQDSGAKEGPHLLGSGTLTTIFNQSVDGFLSQ